MNKKKSPVRRGAKLAKKTVEQKALGLLDALERAGKTASRVSVEGRRIEIDLMKPTEDDEFARVDMRHDKT